MIRGSFYVSFTVPRHGTSELLWHVAARPAHFEMPDDSLDEILDLLAVILVPVLSVGILSDEKCTMTAPTIC